MGSTLAHRDAKRTTRCANETSFTACATSDFLMPLSAYALSFPEVQETPMRLYILPHIILLAFAINLSACGDDTEPNQSDPSDNVPTDVADPTDATDASDPSDETDATDNSDPADESDPEPEPMNCKAYLDCVDNCWIDDPETAEDCTEICDEEASPQALVSANIFYDCMDNCEEEHTNNDAIANCYEEECNPLYDACIAPPECIAGCENYDEICGDDGPLSNRTTYLAGGTHHTIIVPAPMDVRRDRNSRYEFDILS